MLSTFHSIKNLAEHASDCYTLNEQDVKHVQRVLLCMMQDVHRVCEKYHLVYTMSGGCAIGALRHKGFIPWDDDIDICMPRRDYERLPKLLMREYPDLYVVQNIWQRPEYDLNFMKIRLKGTRFMELTDTEPEAAGVFIDVFPVENVYTSPFKRIIQGLYSDGLQFICSCVRIKEKEEKLLTYAKDNRKVEKRIREKACIARLFSFFSFNHWLRLTEHYLRRCKEEHSRWISIPTGRGHFYGELYERTTFFPPQKAQFEDRQFYFPAKPEQYLEKLYGDYMQIPKKNEREYHTVLQFDLGKYKDKGL